MKVFYTLFFAVLFAGLAGSSPARADVFDRIDQCERSGGGSCVYNLLRELARSGHGGHGGLVEAGDYVSESHVITVSSTRSSITINGNDNITERGSYNCSGGSCTHVSNGHRVDVLDTRQFRVTYSGSGNTRIWSRR